MKKTSPTITAAIDAATRARREALERKREAGEPRKPATARPGMERQFEKAAQDAKAFEYSLKLLENEERTKRALARFPRKRKLEKIADHAVNAAIGFGLASLAALGLASAFVLLRLPEPAVQVTAVVGVGVALARTVIEARK